MIYLFICSQPLAHSSANLAKWKIYQPLLKQNGNTLPKVLGFYPRRERGELLLLLLILFFFSLRCFCGYFWPHLRCPVLALGRGFASCASVSIPPPSPRRGCQPGLEALLHQLLRRVSLVRITPGKLIKARSKAPVTRTKDVGFIHNNTELSRKGEAPRSARGRWSAAPSTYFFPFSLEIGECSAVSVAACTHRGSATAPHDPALLQGRAWPRESSPS